MTSQHLRADAADPHNGQGPAAELDPGGSRMTTMRECANKNADARIINPPYDHMGRQPAKISMTGSELDVLPTAGKMYIYFISHYCH